MASDALLAEFPPLAAGGRTGSPTGEAIGHVAEVEIAVDQPRPEVGRPVRIQPGADLVDPRQVGHAGPALVLMIALELPAPAADLAFQEAIDLAQVGQPLGREVD